MFRLLERLRKSRLTWPWCPAIRSHLCPSFAEQVAKLPARLYRRAEEFFVGWFAFALVLTEGEEHFGQGPASAEERIRFFGDAGTLFHQAVAKSNVKVQSSLAKGFRKASIMGIVEVVVQLEAYTEYRVRHVVFTLTNFEKALAEVTAKVKSWPDLECVVVVSSLVQLLTEFPARFPGLTLSTACFGVTERSLSVDVA